MRLIFRVAVYLDEDRLGGQSPSTDLRKSMRFWSLKRKIEGCFCFIRDPLAVRTDNWTRRY